MTPFTLVQQGMACLFRSQERLLRVWFVAPSVVRITFTEHPDFSKRNSRIVIAKPGQVKYSIEDAEDTYCLRTSELTVTVNKATGALSYSTATNRLLMREPAAGGKRLTKRSVTRNIFHHDAAVALSQSTDGARATTTDYETVFDREAFEARLDFVFAKEEALFGLGSHEEGYANLRGRSRDLYQQNMKAVVPHLISTCGYSVLFDSASLMTFHDDEGGSYWWADCVEELDYYVIQGNTYDEIVASYRSLTGTVPIPPKWAFGYVQSKERYVNSEEMLRVVREYRRREIPLDLIVLDWKSWPNDGGWGQKTFDPLRFPAPSQWIEQLHNLGVKLMVSIWPLMTSNCSDQRELLARGLMLGNGSTYNAFSAEARECYWDQAKRDLFAHGVDSWWCDCTEPFEADWKGAVKPDPAQRLQINTDESKLYIDAADINAYSLLHSQGIYEGQRHATPAKRVLNLTRSSYAGQSRYGTFTWNGDICATWESLRHSLAEGLNFCATGEPYWTVDAGGFFLAGRPELWFWRGDYDANTRGLTDMHALEPDAKDTGCTDLGFHELYTRWMQYATFLPMMRSHGTDAAREAWCFGEEGSPFYDAIVAAVRLRSRLLPYIYSLAAAVTLEGASMMTAVALLYPKDRATHDIADQYMFGPCMMICPVTQPMMFGPRSTPLMHAPKLRQVYLPGNVRWYDFWSTQSYDGSQTIDAPAPLDHIPVFVREGSIVLLGKVMQFADEMPDAPYDLHVYSGGNAEFMLYEDDGISYAYETGSFARTRIMWDELQQTLTFHQRQGEFPEMTASREFHVCVHARGVLQRQSFLYEGTEHVCSFREVSTQESAGQ